MNKFYNHIVLAATNSICPNSATLCNPTNAGSINIFLENLLVGFGVIIGIITIGMIVYSGFRMIISQGNEESLTEAKSSLRWSVSGFVLILLAFAIVSAIGKFFQTNPAVSPNPGEIKSPILSDNIITLSQTVFTGLLGFVGIVAIFFIVISGFRYITARGDDEQTTQAKQGLKWAILGLFIATLAYVIVAAVSRLIQPN